jgi:hypothetical protein
MNVTRRLRPVLTRSAGRARSRRRPSLLCARRPGLGTLVRQVKAERLTYLRYEHLADLAEAMMSIERRRLPGSVVEAGTALGGSAIVLAKAKREDRPMKVYDAFGMIPPPSEKDGADVHRRYRRIANGKSAGIGGDVYYGYREDLLAEVTGSFVRLGVPPESNHVEFIKGYYEDSMHIDYPVALAHLDCDWYDSVMTCLHQIEPRLVPGGRLVIDDYDQWSGCARAIDEYFDGRPGYTFVRKSRLHIVKAG